MSLLQLFSDTSFRRLAVSRISDPVVRSFWEHEYSRWKPHYVSEAIAPIQNKVGQFLSNPITRAIIGQPRSRFSLREVMDSSRILIVNLSKGRIGEDSSTLLGSLIVTSLQLAAMSRTDVPEEDRRDYFGFIDEFQNFATESFATILSEARKYRLSLTLANQYLAQLEDAILDAVFGNVGSLLCFQIGARDAETLSEQFGEEVTPQDLMNLPKYTSYLRLLIDGMPSRAFSMETLPNATGSSVQLQTPDVVRRMSRRRYATNTRPVLSQ